MAGKVPNLEPVSSGVRAKGQLRIYWSPFFQKWVAKKWPVKTAPLSFKQAYQVASFSATVQQIKTMTPEDRVAASEMAANTPFLDRDLMMKAANGILFDVNMTDGTTLRGVRILSQEIQAYLDTITTLPGSIIVRTDLGWLGLNPGSPKMVLTMDDAGALPAWEPTQAGSGVSQGVYQFVPQNYTGTRTFSAAARGWSFTPLLDVTLVEVGKLQDLVAGGIYNFGIGAYSAATSKLLSVLWVSPSITAPATHSAQWLKATLAAPLNLNKNTLYLIWLVRTDAGPTVSTTAGEVGAAGFGPGIWGPNTSGSDLGVASIAPGTSDTWGGASGSPSFSLAYTFT